jgi:hypothetical protein
VLRGAERVGEGSQACPRKRIPHGLHCRGNGGAKT